MNAPPPPPPPPHGTNPGQRGGLPDGNYDIFIIPPHSSGSGFLYLPSLQPHRNSFLAGVACTILAVAIWTVVFPVLKEWIGTMVASGGMGVVVLMMGVAVAAWAWGKTQAEGGGPSQGGAGGASHAHAHTHNNPAPEPPPQAQPQPQPQPQPHPSAGPEFRAPPKPTWQRANAGAADTSTNTNGSTFPGATKGSWEKAREETRKKEEDRRRLEEIRKRREEEEKERVKQREKDAREREIRERRERLEKLAKERAQAAAAAAAAATPPPPPPPNPRKPEPARPASPSKRHQQPTAKTATEDDAYSYRPYDEPKRPGAKTASASSIYSESSYAPSQSTSRTTPPPSHRGPYRSKDPDKIVLKAVYSFNNTFLKVPIAQLVSGVGSVTDGLILRITTEGLFIDDDVRNVPQREWDVKAWTLKLVEVWCPHLHLGASSGSNPASRSAASPSKPSGKKDMPTGEESDLFLESLRQNCKPVPISKNGSSLGTKSNSKNPQSGQSKELHVLRASIRDQEGKRYVFVLPQEEAWKVAVGLQRLRRGTQVRALGVSGLAANESKAILEGMGWS
ncbi:MAG: hypothetical protein HETSPECPRED_008814 [Heterodermia speciosa]|uniref:Uncharacterized protein n=1 Tax=Heterodermia speciosa TaxID=116794 RepID=A0A8H3IAF5_9LECA|nr:MAG: hypothetical protein HETSPECPRED_008814 [Heterodermia speciosa]